jgi:G:T-mismatch repair DNA endonuclease (very short patch repair protein)
MKTFYLVVIFLLGAGYQRTQTDKPIQTDTRHFWLEKLSQDFNRVKQTHSKVQNPPTHLIP